MRQELEGAKQKVDDKTEGHKFEDIKVLGAKSGVVESRNGRGEGGPGSELGEMEIFLEKWG